MASLTNEPETFQHYQVMRREDGTLWELGRGAMGVTYKAFDTNLRAPVALKVINALHLDSETSRARFVREARAAAGLRHRNVASVYHLGHDDQSFFYAMEFVDGDTVEGLVKRQGVLKPVTALQIALQVSRALGAAAKQQLVHRDIKPANLMVVAEDDEDDQFAVKVIDFGLARPALGGEGSAHITMGGFVGTPQYASPEQLEEKELDARSDIYSLGITLWYMLAGKPPFAGALGSVFIQQLTKEPPWEHLKGTPKTVTDLLALMLAKEPEKRPQSPTELRRAIETCLKKLPAETGRIFISREGADFADLPTVAPETSTPTRETLSTETPLTSTPTETGSAVMTSAPTGAAATGTILAGRYALDFQAGEGNNGRVFRARDLDRGSRIAAVKIFHRGVLEVPAELARLEENLTKLRENPHPSLLQFESFRRIGDVKYLAGDWVNGFNLVELLRARGKLAPRETMSLLAQAAAATDHAKIAQLPGPELASHQILIDFPDEPVESSAAPGTNAGTRTLLPQTVDHWPRFVLKLDATGILREAGDSVTLAGDMTMLPARPGLERDTQSSIRGLVADSHVFSLAALAYEMLSGSPPAANVREEGRDSRYVALSALNESGNALLRKALSPNPGFATSTEFFRELAEASGFGPEIASFGTGLKVADASGQDAEAAETMAFQTHGTPAWAASDPDDSSAETLIQHAEPSSKAEALLGADEHVAAVRSAESDFVPAIETPSPAGEDGSEAATLQAHSFRSQKESAMVPLEVDSADPRNPAVEKDDYGADGSDAPTLQGYSFKTPVPVIGEVTPPLLEVVRDTYGLDDAGDATLQDFSFKAPPEVDPDRVEAPTTARKDGSDEAAQSVDALTPEAYRFKTSVSDATEIIVAREGAPQAPQPEAATAPELEAPTLQGYSFKSADAPSIEIPPADRSDESVAVPVTETPSIHLEAETPTLQGYSFKAGPAEVILPTDADVDLIPPAAPESKQPALTSLSESEAAPTLLDFSLKDELERKTGAPAEDGGAARLIDIPASTRIDEPAIAETPEPPVLRDEFLTVADAPLSEEKSSLFAPGTKDARIESGEPAASRTDRAEVSRDDPVLEPAPVRQDATQIPVPEVSPARTTPDRSPEPVFTDRPITDEPAPKQPNFALIGIVAAIVVLGIVGAAAGLRKTPQPGPVTNIPGKSSPSASPGTVLVKAATPPPVNPQPSPAPSAAVVVQSTPATSTPSNPFLTGNDEGLQNSGANPGEAGVPTSTPGQASVAVTGATPGTAEKVNPPNSTPSSTRSNSRDNDDDDEEKADTRRNGQDNRRREPASTPRPVAMTREPRPTPERVIKRDPPRSETPKPSNKPPPKQATPPPAENRPRGPAVPFMR